MRMTVVHHTIQSQNQLHFFEDPMSTDTTHTKLAPKGLKMRQKTARELFLTKLRNVR